MKSSRVYMFALLLLAGCDPASGSAPSASAPADREAQCEVLRKTINDGITKLEAMPDSDDPVKDLEAQAKQLDAIADAVDKSGVTDAELKKVADDYAKLRRDDAKNQRAVAAAAKAGDEKKMDALEKAGEASSKSEEDLTAKLEKMCE